MINRDRLEMEMNMLTSKRVKIYCFLVWSHTKYLLHAVVGFSV